MVLIECDTISSPASFRRWRKSASDFFLKRAVADRGQLVDEIPVEGDAHRHAEAEPGLHAAGIGAHRHVHEVAELGEVGDVVDQRVGIHAVDPRHEAHVLLAGERGVEAAAEPERPGDRLGAADRAGIRLHDAGDHAEQRRLAGAVAAQHPDLGARGQCQVQPVEHHLAAGRRQVVLGNVAEFDHLAESEEQHVERRPDASRSAASEPTGAPSSAGAGRRAAGWRGCGGFRQPRGSD